MKTKIYTGSTKTLYKQDENNHFVMSFNDTLRLSNKKIVEFSGKGAINNSISALLMQKLDLIGIETHFLRKINMRQQLVEFVDIFPVQIYVTSLSSGRYIKEFGIESGFVFDSPMIDFRVKNHELNYPTINENQIYNFGWLMKSEIKELKNTAIRVHDFLSGFFAGCGIRLVEIKLEFGRIFNGEEFFIALTDEISPDSCKLWDLNTNENLCHELAETNPELLIPAYQKLLKKLDIKR